MRNKIGLVGMLLFTAGLALVACAPGGGSGPSSDQEPAQDMETPAIAEETETPMTDSESQEMVLYVGPVLVDCEGEGPQKCMLVKEDPDGEYGLFYDQIEGFEHEKGFEYQLLVSTEPVEDPPAGASSIKWTLVEVVDKQLSLEGNLWGLESYAGNDGQMVDVIPGSKVTAEFVDGQINGSAGCNNYFGSYELSGNSLTMSGPFGITEMFCAEPEGVMEQENQYLAALQSVTTYEIKADVLEMFDADGTRMVTYQAAAIGEATDAPPAPDEVLANTEYQSEWTESGTAPLVDSEYREQAAPGSASEIVVRLTEHVAYGQLSDGREAAAVILVTETGGSGTFYDLAVVVEEDGQPVNVATTFLGDRVKIENLVFVGSEILVEMVNQGPEDPMCCPTQRVVQTYELQGEELVQTSSRIVGTEGSTGDGG